MADLGETARLSQARYEGRTSTYLEVLDAQRSLYSAELTLAEARGDEYRSLVQLYKSAWRRLAAISVLRRPLPDWREDARSNEQDAVEVTIQVRDRKDYA